MKRRLGEGTDGEVFETARATAVKACKYDGVYFNERDTYLHLQDYGVADKLGDFYIPSLWGYNDELYVLEMDYIHKAPFVVDFGKVRLFRDPEFPDDVRRDNELRGEELFGENWPRVKTLLADLESYQIYYLDPKPGNIEFP